jgi:hypothetical protein
MSYRVLHPNKKHGLYILMLGFLKRRKDTARRLNWLNESKCFYMAAHEDVT